MLAEGDSAPDFALKDAEGKTWSLSDLTGQKVILYFYPADDTPGCTTQSCDFRDASQELRAAGYQVLGVSPQGADSHRRFADKYGLGFPLLVDEGRETARAFGAYKEAEASTDAPIRIKRSTFVIDENGRITLAQYGVKAQNHVAQLTEKLGVSV